MSLEVRSAMIQARVVPWVKRAGQDVLRAMGLTMSDAMELFLRRVIEDRKLPFDIVAIDRMPEHDLEQGRHEQVDGLAGAQASRRGSWKKNSKSF